jgi:phosphatidylglycerol:prolipoprotein diacylglycerol transferase
MEDPLIVFKVWEGGMASHGGIIGLVIFTWFYARKKKVSWRGLGDGLCVVSPLGLFFGRMANFINGELYGRAAQGVSWAMKFPLTLVDSSQPESYRLPEALEAAAAASPRFNKIYSAVPPLGEPAPSDLQLFDQMLAIQKQEPAVSKAIEPFLQPRHPSQLYEAVLEGLALFAILWFVRIRYPKAPAGVLTGLFFLFYAVFRIISEQFREPDAEKFGVLTRGQFLSLFMIVGGIIFLTSHRWVKSKYPATMGAAGDAAGSVPPPTSGS